MHFYAETWIATAAVIFTIGCICFLLTLPQIRTTQGGNSPVMLRIGMGGVIISMLMILPAFQAIIPAGHYLPQPIKLLKPDGKVVGAEIDNQLGIHR